MITTLRVPQTRAVLIAGLLTFGLLGAVVTPAVAAPTTYEFDLADVETSRSGGSFNYELSSIAPDVETLQITLPPDASDLTIAGGDTYVEVDGAYYVGSLDVTGNVVSLDLSTISLTTGQTISTFITVWDGADFESSPTTRSVFLFSTVGIGNGGQNVLNVNLGTLEPTFSNESEYFDFGGLPTVVKPGDSVIVSGPTGYFSAGPDSNWDPGLTEAFGVVYGFDYESYSTATVSSDGSTLTISVPRPHWSFELDAVLAKYGTLYQQYFNESDDFIGFDAIDVRLPITYAPAPTPGVERVAGADRFTVAQNIARQSYPTGADVVYITNGLNYPDALSAAPAAAFAGGPLLLTFPSALPAGLAETITTLAPERIIVVGGVNSVDESVYADLSTLVGGNIERLGGADRFAASRNLTVEAFGAAGAPVVYLATGLNFPDALSASAAAGAIGAPVILINGTQQSLDNATLQLLETLGTQNVYIAGGPNSVSDGILESIYDAGFSAERLSGADRFEASSNIARVGFRTAERVFLATGFNFPDALAGAAWAASIGAPLIVIPGNCIPARVLSDLENYQVSEVTILGGPNSVTTAVESLTPCAGFAWQVESEALGSAEALVAAEPSLIDRITERITAGR